MFPATMNIEKNVMQAYVILTDTTFYHNYLRG